MVFQEEVVVVEVVVVEVVEDQDQDHPKRLSRLTPALLAES